MKIPLTKNFSVQEVQHSDYAIKNHIDNVLPSVYYMNAIELAANILEPIRKRFGAFSPQSWYRGESVNKGVGGSKNSDHMTARAADIRIEGVDVLELAIWIRDNLDFDQVILEPSWVHVSYRKGENRKQVLHKTKDGYEKGLE